MKALIKFMLLTAITSCDKVYNYPEPVNSEIINFLNDAKKYNVGIKLKGLKVYLTDNLGDGVNGLYYPSEHAICFDTSSLLYKNNLDYLVYHELGHALLKLNHNKDSDLSGNPTSIMNGKPKDWHSNKEHYVQKLFESCKKINFKFHKLHYGQTEIHRNAREALGTI